MLAEQGHDVTCLYFDEGSGTPFFPISHAVDRINLAPPSRRSKSRLGKAMVVIRKVYEKLVHSPLGPLVARPLWTLVNGRFIKQLRYYFAGRPTDLAISFLPPANTPTLIAGKASGVAVVPTNHNVPQEDFASPARWDPNPYDRKLRLDSLRNAAAVHVLFPSFAEWFPEDIRRTIVPIPNYVSGSIVDHGELVEREKVIIAVGRLSKVKNYSVLVEAWSRIAAEFPDWKVRLFGTGPESGRLAAEIKRRGLDQSFELGGHTQAIGLEYAKSAIMCHPALFEGFGLSAAEALANRVPVVAFADCAGINQFVGDKNGVLVPRETGAAGLAEALSLLMRDESYRERLAAAGPEILTEFSIEKYQDRWLRLIERVTNAAHA